MKPRFLHKQPLRELSFKILKDNYLKFFKDSEIETENNLIYGKKKGKELYDWMYNTDIGEFQSDWGTITVNNLINR